MPVLVFKDELSPDNFVYQAELPEISAQKYLVADINNNFVFLQNNQSEKIPFAGFSQVLSSLVATDYINIEKNITLNTAIYNGVKSSRVKADSTITPFDLLHLSLRGNDNTSLKIFANYLSEKRFTRLMNDKAIAVGMKQSVFTLDENENTSYTRPEDLFYLSKYIYHNRKFLFEITAGKRTNSAYSKSIFADVPNESIFMDKNSFVGGKVIAQSDGSKSFFGVFEIRIKNETRPIFVYFGNSTNLEGEVTKTLDYIQQSYQ